jgi:excisionase family DNA binding protein
MMTQVEGNDDFLTTRELARWLKVDERTPEGWRARGAGPPFIRLGATVRYSRRAVREWMNARVVDPRTPDEGN